MRYLASLFVGLMLLYGVSTVGYAETGESFDSSKSPFYATLYSGYALNYEGDGDSLNGFSLAGKLGYDINRYLGAELESGWTVYEQQSEAGITVDNINIIPLLFNLNVRYPVGNFVPYVVGGLGVYFFHLNENIEGTTATINIDNAAFGGKVGGGFDYYFTETMALNFESGLNIINNPEATISAGGLSISTPGEVDNWYIGGGLKFRF